MSAAIVRRKRRKLKSEINVFPIDVMLVLLIIFMVTALLTLSFDVDLQSTPRRWKASRTR